MEIDFSKDVIIFEKELNHLDRFVIDFTKTLNEAKVKYVIVSGYVAILFGRSRSSEDIDLFIERIDQDRFRTLWKSIIDDFTCLNTNNPVEAYVEYLKNRTALRFARPSQYIPNMEVKFPKNALDVWTLSNRKRVQLNEHTFSISPLELQIPFKLYLGSEKDIEDARYLFRLFQEKLDLTLLDQFNRKLKVVDLYNTHLR